jgi:hypothetical protein
MLSNQRLKLGVGQAVQRKYLIPLCRLALIAAGISVSRPPYKNLATACRLGRVDDTATFRLGGVGRKQTRKGSKPMSRILVVEDNPDLRLIVAHVLVDEGYEVDAAENLQQGRALLDISPAISSSQTESFRTAMALR